LLICDSLVLALAFHANPTGYIGLMVSQGCRELVTAGTICHEIQKRYAGWRGSSPERGRTRITNRRWRQAFACIGWLFYTSDAAARRSSVDLVGRRLI